MSDPTQPQDPLLPSITSYRLVLMDCLESTKIALAFAIRLAAAPTAQGASPGTMIRLQERVVEYESELRTLDQLLANRSMG